MKTCFGFALVLCAALALHGDSWRTASADSLHIDSKDVYQGPTHDVGFRVVIAPEEP